MNWRKIRIATTTTLMLGVVGIGAYNALFPPQVAPAAQETKQPTGVSVDSTQGAATYALYFTNYWLTGNLKEAEKYAAKGFEVPDRLPKPQKVENIITWGARSLDDNRVMVTIRARVGMDRVLWLEVPVVAERGSYGVYDVPAFAPEPGTAKRPQAPEIEPIDNQSDAAGIRQTIQSFFRNYAEGSPEDLANLFLDGKPRSVLDPSLEARFLKEGDLDISSPENGRVYVLATTPLRLENRTIPQTYEFWLKKSGSKWLIEKTNPAIPLVP